MIPTTTTTPLAGQRVGFFMPKRRWITSLRPGMLLKDADSGYWRVTQLHRDLVILERSDYEGRPGSVYRVVARKDIYSPGWMRVASESPLVEWLTFRQRVFDENGFAGHALLCRWEKMLLGMGIMGEVIYLLL